MPSPYDLFPPRSRSRAASVISRTTSTVSATSSLLSEPKSIASEGPQTKGQFVTRMTREGIPRQYRIVRRRKKTEMTTTVASLGVSTDDKTNIELAGNIFVADLLNIDAWPEDAAKERMVVEAMSQANANAHTKSRHTTELTTSIQGKVRSLPHFKYPTCLYRFSDQASRFELAHGSQNKGI